MPVLDAGGRLDFHLDHGKSEVVVAVPCGLAGYEVQTDLAYP